MFQPVADTCQVVFRFDRNSVDHNPQIDLYFKRDGGWSGQDLDALCTFYGDGFATTWGLDDFLWQYDTLNRITARDLSEEFGNYGEETLSIPGTDTTQFTSPNCACLVEFKGSSGAAPRQGGIFWPAVPEGKVDGQGNLDATWAQDLTDALSTMLTASLTSEAPYSQVIVSRYHKRDGVEPPYYRDPALTKVVTSRAYRPVIASQRGRRDRP